MSEQELDEVDGAAPRPAEDGEVVHWMKPKPLSVGAAGMSITAGAAFTVGVLATLGVLAMVGWLGPEREVEVPVRRRWRT